MRKYRTFCLIPALILYVLIIHPASYIPRRARFCPRSRPRPRRRSRPASIEEESDEKKGSEKVG